MEPKKLHRSTVSGKCYAFMNKELLVIGLFFALLVIASVNLVIADYELGEPIGEVEEDYGLGDLLQGWLNISFENEPVDSVITAFSSETSIINFLENANAEYNCSPADCESGYEISSGETEKSFSINYGESYSVGIRFQGTLSEEPIKDISFQVSTDAGASCTQPLLIDFYEDKEIEWRSFNSISSFECTRSAGCYDVSEEVLTYGIGASEYCEKITLADQPVFRVGAYIEKGDTADVELTMTVYNEDLDPIGECELEEIVTNGEKSCKVWLNLTKFEGTDSYICISANKETNYQIRAENGGDICGFYGIDNYDNFERDYYIFAEGGKYASVGSATIDDGSYQGEEFTDLKEYLNEFLYSNYEYNCESNCIIPIRFISGINQQVIISNLDLKYDTTSGMVTDESRFYEINQGDAKVTADFQRLDLKYADLYVPDDIGNKVVVIEINNDDIMRRNINVFPSSQILDVKPRNPSALVPVIFTVVLGQPKDNLTYSWDFGDGTSETTNINIVKHTYANQKAYNLTVTVSGLSQGIASKTVLITAGSPKDSIKDTIIDYKSDINNLESQTGTYPDWIADKIKEKLDLEDIKSTVSTIENSFNLGVNDDQALEIMRELLSLKVPYKIEISSEISSDFIQSKNQLDLFVLEELRAGYYDSEVDSNEYYKAINNWINNHLEASIDSKSYIVYFRDVGQETIYSYIGLTTSPKIYFAVNGGSDIFIRGLETNEVTGRAIGAKMVVDGVKSIEILYPGDVDILNIPVYISPEFSELTFEQGIVVRTCNNNDKCEESETKESCPEDCSKKGIRATLLIIILLLVALAVYIALQEWYKRRYESSLFKNKNQLFNLITFMHSSSNQGLKRLQIFDKLKEMGWRNEQINFAWNKFKGKRTGMWEIPVFKSFENKKVRTEIRRREGNSFNSGGFESSGNVGRGGSGLGRDNTGRFAPR